MQNAQCTMRNARSTMRCTMQNAHDAECTVSIQVCRRLMCRVGAKRA
jgi:hypothetical protein